MIVLGGTIVRFVGRRRVDGVLSGAGVGCAARRVGVVSEGLMAGGGARRGRLGLWA